MKNNDYQYRVKMIRRDLIITALLIFNLMLVMAAPYWVPLVMDAPASVTEGTSEGCGTGTLRELCRNNP